MEGIELLADLPETDRRTTHKRVYEALRWAILGGSFSSGDRLVQSQIAAQMRVSTTPVREALRDLASEGLIRFDPYRGAVVDIPGIEDIREIYKLRLILEPEAIRETVKNMTADELKQADDLQRRMDKEKDPADWVELNREFHALLDDASRSPRMCDILRNLRDRAAIIVALSFRARPNLIRRSNEEHNALLDACRRRDANAAARIVKTHFQATVDAMEEYFAGAHGGHAGGQSRKQTRPSLRAKGARATPGAG